jgi:hypothetical protein
MIKNVEGMNKRYRLRCERERLQAKERARMVDDNYDTYTIDNDEQLNQHVCLFLYTLKSYLHFSAHQTYVFSYYHE